MTRQDVIDSLKHALDERAEKGCCKYGERLHTHNGRDADRDAWEELLDLVIYQRQAILERDQLMNGEGERWAMKSRDLGGFARDEDGRVRVFTQHDEAREACRAEIARRCEHFEPVRVRYEITEIEED